MKRLIIFVVVITIGTYINSYAQVPTKVLSKNQAFEKYPKFEISQKNSRIIKLPKFDIASFLEEDEAIKGLDVPFRFGKGFDVDYSLQDGYWENTTDGRVWSLVVESDGAYSINFIFNELFLPPKGELYIYNDDGSMVYGPVTNKQNLTKGLFLTDLVQGDKVTLHIFEPSNFKEKTRLRINRIVHAYKNMYSGYSTGPGTAEACHNNIDCYPNWGDESDGIALILLSSGTEWCTGGMVNNTANDYTPNILTAFHCIDVSYPYGSLSSTEISNAESWMFKFGFRYNECGGMNYWATTFNGANYLSGWVETDFALLEMNESPVGNDNIAYLGWDNRDNTPTSGIGIHHPSGDYMKISFENNSFSTSTWGPGGLTDGHWLINFDDGVVEHGSSGSPIFNQDGRIVGQLHGNFNYNEAEDYCDQPRAEYGRFDFSWNGNNTNATQLAHWLDPNSTGASTTNLLRSPSLTVPDVICYSGTTVSIQNAPNVTITWGGISVSYPYGNTGTSVTVRASSSSTSNNGTVTASFTVNNIPYTITHPVWVGTPSFTWDYVNSDTELSPFEYGFAYP
ncbi:MAG TPA: hypothetical protein DCG69_00295, partial [Bacteroidales bacterium]|nr:hypothetical protein [Bacteroidales bacterium]